MPVTGREATPPPHQVHAVSRMPFSWHATSVRPLPARPSVHIRVFSRGSAARLSAHALVEVMSAHARPTALLPSFRQGEALMVCKASAHSLPLPNRQYDT